MTGKPAASTGSSTMNWTAREITPCGWPHGRIRVFTDHNALVRHVDRHLLRQPEAAAWWIIIPALSAYGSPETAQHVLYQAVRNREPLWHDIYRLYSESICLNIADACRLNWMVYTGAASRVSLCFGTSGVLVVVANNTVRTAFVPGLLDKPQGPIRRSQMRQGVDRADVRRRLAREQAWCDAQRLFYRAFRPAIGFLRRAQYIPPKTPLTTPNDYYLLKDHLPLGRRYTYEQWRQDRLRARGLLYDPRVN